MCATFDDIAQLVEQVTVNHLVVGSSPSIVAIFEEQPANNEKRADNNGNYRSKYAVCRDWVRSYKHVLSIDRELNQDERREYDLYSNLARQEQGATSN